MENLVSLRTVLIYNAAITEVPLDMWLSDARPKEIVSVVGSEPVDGGFNVVAVDRAPYRYKRYF